MRLTLKSLRHTQKAPVNEPRDHKEFAILRAPLQNDNMTLQTGQERLLQAYIDPYGSTVLISLQRPQAERDEANK